MAAKLAFEIEIDSASNLVRTHFRGHVTGAVMQEGVVRVESLLNKIPPGFTVLADLSELDLMDLDCGPYLARIMDLCRAHGVGKVLRVIPDPAKDIGVNILSIIHYRGKVPIATFETLAQAQKELLERPTPNIQRPTSK